MATTDATTLDAGLRQGAIILAGEPAWPPERALKVVAALERRGIAVLGIELWRAHGTVPEWVASSDFEIEAAAPDYIERSASAASSFIRRFANEPGALFNLTWHDRGG